MPSKKDSNPRSASGLFRPVDAASLAFFRMGFSLCMLWDVLLHVQHGRLRYFWILPDFTFTYPGFGWVQAWPGIGMYLHFGLLALLALFIGLGLFYRLATILFFLGFTYVFLLDQAMYINHGYLICLVSFLLIFLPANRLYALDTRFRNVPSSDVTPAWTIYLLRFQIGLVYFFGGIAKLNNDWFHGEPIRTWFISRSDWPVVGPWFLLEPVVYFFTYSGLLFDLLIVPLLLWKRTRVLAFVLAVAFHLTNAWLFSIGIFPWFMIMATTVFFAPSWPRRWLHTAPEETAVATPPHRTAVLWFLALYAATQVALPLRHFLYPGNSSWTEEGHNFSWHMKLNKKEGLARFFVTDLDTYETWTINAADYLTAWQAKRMPTRPDMVLLFARHLAGLLAAEGHAHVRVTAGVMVSLNGREPQLLIDPKVDLTKVRRSLKPATWILPLHEPLPLRPERRTMQP